MMHGNFRNLIILSSGIVLELILLLNASYIIAENNSPDCLSDIANWGNSPEQIAAVKGAPGKSVISQHFTAYTYPLSQYDVQGEISYYFDEKGLNSIQLAYLNLQKTQKDSLFIRLESALTCLFKEPSYRLDASKNGVELAQALWENDNTLAYLSSFSTMAVITVKFMDKKSKSNQAELTLLKKIRDRTAESGP